MLTRKHLRRARRKMTGWPAGAPAVRRSLAGRLGRTAAMSPDVGERTAAGAALSVLTAHGWADSGFDELDVPVPRRPRPVRGGPS